MSFESVDELESDVDFTHEKMFELEQRVEHLEKCMSLVVKLLKLQMDMTTAAAMPSGE